MLCKDESAHYVQRDGAFQCIRDGLRRKHVHTACLLACLIACMLGEKPRHPVCPHDTGCQVDEHHLGSV